MTFDKRLLWGAGLGAAAGAAFWWLRGRGGVTTGQLAPSSTPPTSGSHSSGFVPQGDVSMVDTSSADAFFGTLSAKLPTRSQQLYEIIKTRPSFLDTPYYVNVSLPDFNGHSGVIGVTSDAVKLYGVRINVDQYYGQLITDFFGGVAMTRKAADAVYSGAVYVPSPTVYDQLPGLRPALADMKTTAAMVLHSQGVDKKLADLGDNGSAYNLRCNLGKDWLLNANFWAAGLNGYPYCGRAGMSGSVPMGQTSCNYGWWVPGTPVVSPIQGAAHCHNYNHADYSQVLRFLSGTMTVDGETRNTADVLMDSEVAGLLIDEVSLAGWRHPGVPIDETAVS